MKESGELMPRLERDFQSQLKRDIKKRVPGCLIMKTDPTQIQGIPDLLIIFEDKYAFLEVKRSSGAAKRPNQGHYISKYKQWAFTSFVSPENKEEVLDALERALKS